MHRALVSRVLTALVCLLVASPAMAAITANTGTSLPWESTSTWQGGVVPTPADDVLIPLNSSVVISGTTGNVTINNLTLQAGILANEMATLSIGSAELVVNGSLALNNNTSTAQITFSDASGILDVNGDISGDGTLAFASTGGTLELAGDFLFTGFLSASGGEVVLDGGGQQTWQQQTTLNDLTITNSFADVDNGIYASVVFSNGIIVNGTFSLQGGVVDSNVSGVQSFNPISRTSGHIYGYVDQFISGGNTVTIPVGDPLNYAPVQVTALTSGSLTVRTNDWRYTTAGDGASLQRHWELFANDVTVTGLVFFYNDVDVTGDESSYVLGHTDGTGAWLRYGPTTFNSGTNVMGYTNATPFAVDGYWTAGEPAAVTTATQLEITTINQGVTPLRQNTPFDLVIEAQDGSGNPATISSFTDLTLTASGGSGILSDIDGNTGALAGSMASGAMTKTYFDLLYSAADTVTLTITDTSCCQTQLPGDSQSVSFSAPQSQLEVTTTENYGLGSLRHALNTANAGGCTNSPCYIGFNIPPAMADLDGFYKIVITGLVVQDEIGAIANNTRGLTPTSMTVRGLQELPQINVAVEIDGTSQPGYDTQNPAPLIDVSIGQSQDGIWFAGPASTLRGIAIHGGNAVVLGGSGGHTVEGCYIGLQADGTLANAGAGDTFTGVYVSTANNTIGGHNLDGSPSALKRNIISGGSSEGIYLEFAQSTNILGNYIGTDPAGTSARPNGSGIYTIGANTNTIGGVQAGARNVIAGNNGVGIVLFADTGSESEGKQNTVVNNYIGLGADGTTFLPNGLGIVLDGDTSFENVIGGMTAGQGNVIAGNDDEGIRLLGDTYDNVIFGNSFYENGGIAIDHHADTVLNTNDPGDGDINNGDTITANNGQNRPVINRAEVFGSDLEVDVTVDSSDVGATQSIRVEVFKGFNGQPKFYVGGTCFSNTNFVNDFTVFLDNAGVAATDEIFATATSFTSTNCSVSDTPGVYNISDGTSEYSDGLPATACTAPNTTVSASGATTFCDGGSVTLSAPTILGYTYQWFESGTPINGQTAFSLNVTTSGSYTVEVTNSTGCSAMSSATAVTVNPVPSAPTASNTGAYCEGGTIQLNATTVAGATYAWSGPNGFTSTLQNPTLPATLAAAGNYSVTATVNSCTSTASTTSVVVNATPATPTASNGGPSCENATIQLNAAFVSGAAYAWTGPNGFTSTAQNPTLTATTAAAGVYTVTATVNGCTSASSSTTVVVNATPATPTASNGGPYCENDTIQLNAAFVSGASYTWSGPNGFTSNLQNPTLTATAAAAGTYTVFATVGTCNSASSATTVAVNATPATPTASNGGPYCENATVQLNAATVAGASYTWTGPNGFTSNLQNPTLTATAAAAGTYTVFATVGACNSASSATTVVVTAPPATPAASNGGPYCEGATIQLNASTIPGAAYTWSGPNGFTSTDQNPTLTAAAAASGTYTVFATVNGCASASSNTTVTVNAAALAPAASNGGPYCEGSSIQLFATTVAGALYSWTGPNGFTSSDQNPVIPNANAATHSGVYNVTATVNGCTSPAGSTSVTVNTATPTPGASNGGPYCEGATIQLSAATITDASYAWTGPNGFTSTLQNPTLAATVAASGTYTVVATVNGCASASSSTGVIVNAAPAAPVASNGGPYCENATIQLFATTVAGATYAWTGPNGFTSTAQNPTLAATAAAAGIYTVTATVNGCGSASSSTEVFVNSASTAPTATNAGPYCEGSTIQLNASFIAGATYSWTGPNGFTSTVQNPTLSASLAAAGTYTVTATVNGCSSGSGSTNVAVNAAPGAPVASNGGPYCEGATIQLNASTIAGATYLWTGPNGFTSTLQNPTLAATAANAGIYNVKAVVNGCASSFESTQVVVNGNPNLVINAQNSVCASSTGNVASVDPIQGATYSWSITNGFITSGTGTDTITYTAGTTGSVTLNVSVTTGSCTSSGSTNVAISASPTTTITAPSEVQASTNGNASIPSPPAGATVTWTVTNGTLLSGQGTSAITFEAGSSGSVGIGVTVEKNGCVSTGSASVAITQPPGADLQVTKSAPASVATGESFTYTITIYNAGPETTTVLVTDTFPAGLELTGTSTAAGNWNCTGSNSGVTCSGTLSSGATQTISLTVNAPQSGGTITNTVEVAAQSTFDPNISNNTATATTSVVAQVTCATTPPSLLSPANNATVTSPVAFSWSAVTGATLYELWINNSNAATLAGTTTSTSLTAAVPSGTSSWYVTAQLASGCDALVSASRTFNVEVSNNCDGTTAPQINAPAEGASLTSPVTVSWTAVPQAVGYRVWISDDGGALQDIGTTNGALTLLIAAPSGSITLYVDALFSGCPAKRSAAVNFTVPEPDPCAVRGSAAPTSPASNATLDSSNVTFVWTAAPDADGYRLWASIDGAAAVVLESTDDTSTTEKLDSGFITWWVETLYDGCASTESQRRSFTLPAKQNCGTSRPELVSPAGNSSTNSTSVTFTWSNIDSDAVGYELWLALNNGTPSLLASLPAGTASVTKEVPAGTLNWFVRALVDRCPSRDSQTRTFTVTPPDACADNRRPVPSTPSDNNEVTSPVSFTYSTTDGATSYEVFVARGSSSAASVGTSSTGELTGINLPTGSARWFVRAHFPNGCPSLDSEETEFKVVPRPDACATLTPPVISAPGQISADTEFRIQWTPEPAATQYQLQVATDPDFNNASITTTSATAADLTQANDTGAPLALYARVRAIDTRCLPIATVSAYGPVSAILILPQQGDEGSVDLTHGDSTVEYSIVLGPEYAGQTFTATSKDSFLTITPSTGVVPAGGITLIVKVDTSSLPVGATIGSVTISLNGTTVSSNATSVVTPISINLVTPVAPTTKNTPPPDAMIIPAVASAAGIGAQFESDVRVSNTSPQLMKYQLSFVPTGEAGISAGKQTTFSVEPGRTIALDDILKTWFGTAGTNAVGSLEIRPLTQTSNSLSSSAVGALSNIVSFASSRTFNVTPNGTFGQYIPAVPFANFLGKAATDALGDVFSLQQISQSTKFRTNLGFVEGSGEKVDLLVKVFGANGSLLGSFPVNLNGGQHTQLNLNQKGFNVEDGRVEVQVVGGNGKITAYASVLDNATADAVLVTPVTLSQQGNTKWVIPGVADVATGFANWKSDMRVFNPGDQPVTVNAAFYSQNGGEPKVNTLTIEPGQVKQLDKVLPTLFNVTGDGGAVHLSTDTPKRLIATARTYNETSTGSYGLFASAVTPAEAVGVGSRPLQLLQVEESTRFRSNIGFAEVTGKPVTIEVSVVPPDAKFTAVAEIELSANEFRQIGSLLQTLGLGETYNARISVRAISGEGRATAYAAVIDMKTNDPTYVPAQ
jgi:Domain of unknown function DUF11/Ig-like domain CHU_C associated